ncbi:Glycosyltransferase involved in cell wall bisynthesis [Sanguibacter gelidistatuariae]|uniref:Glycosyltransferase involved in cell wall bisynthesis n=1 Tax=Sanguibacter gelidistatuariae TaxID=1814289 RepID=A0A1G6QAA0_9MICO|nr:glycosyltransferase [Sanguibacter gelidistatuariae]SDC89432.1 Glycosyltransferase involved in cell wall bisynthesis [Sanguibacter gelidistatuariae]
MTNLVVFSLERWDNVWRRNQILLAGLLHADPELRVLFVEPPEDPLHSLHTKHLPRLGRGVVRRGRRDGVPDGRLWTYQPTKWLPRRAGRALGATVDERMAQSVMRAARRLRLVDPLLWVNDPAGATLVRLSAWPSLYDITDDWLVAKRSPEQHAKLLSDENLLLAACSAVVVCSPALAESKGTRRQVVLIPNAVDVEAFREPRRRPVDLPREPIALYVGTVHADRIDLPLCVHLAEELNRSGHGTLVLVGPALLTSGQRACLLAAGIVLLGARPHLDIPAYLQHAEVLVVPHVVDPFTDSLDPIKLYEYQAIGRPVVSTPVAGFRDLKNPVTHIAEGSGFTEAVIGILLSPHLPTGPGPLMPGIPTWAERVVAMQKVLGGLRPLQM